MRSRWVGLVLGAALCGCSANVEEILGLQVVGASPGVVRGGDTDVAWTVAGTGFVDGATVSIDEPGVTITAVTVESANEITFRLTAPNTVAAGTATLTVTNPDMESRARDVSTIPQTITLSGSVQPILDSLCTGCHFGGAPAAGLVLTSGLTHGSLVGVPSTQVPALDLVEAGDAAASYLIEKVAGTQTVGARMPPSGTPLSQTQVAIVVAWIEGGALDD